jgi:hypothetical protein
VRRRRRGELSSRPVTPQRVRRRRDRLFGLNRLSARGKTD